MSRWLIAGLVGACVVTTSSLAAQAADTAEVAEARDLIAGGAYEDAARELAVYLERYPDDVGVRWLLARTLYWDGEHERARRQLGMVFERDPDYAPATELWRELRWLWAPRIEAGLGLHSDDQSLHRQWAALEGDLPLSPWVGLLADGGMRHLDAPSSGGVVALEGRVGMRAALREAPVEAVILAGLHGRPALGRTAFVGSGRLAVTLPANLNLGAGVRRWSYEFTTSAVDTMVMVERYGADLSRSDPTGWGGSAGGRIDRFPAGHHVRHAWLWVLAPIWTDGRGAVRLGYAFQGQDADTTTLRLAESGSRGGGSGGGVPGPGPIVPRPPPGGGAPAVYDPYYTPEQSRAHLALAAFQAPLSSTVTVSADGGVGIFAREQAPAFVSESDGGTVATDSLTLRFRERDYTPWRIRGRLSAELSPTLTLRFEAAYREEAFFRTGSVSVRLTWGLLEGLERP